MTTKLKPCPFCGATPTKSVRATDNGFRCNISCHCGGYTAKAYQFANAYTAEHAELGAIEAWNRRADSNDRPNLA